MTMDWKRYLINQRNVAQYNELLESNEYNNEEILEEVFDYITEHPDDYNIPVDFFIFLCTQDTSDYALQTIEKVMPFYNSICQHKFNSSVKTSLNKIKKEELMEEKKKMEIFLERLKNLIPIQKEAYTFIRLILNYEKNQNKSMDRRKKYNTDVERIMDVLDINQLFSALIELTEEDSDILVRAIFYTPSLEVIKKKIEEEIKSQTDIGKKIALLASHYVKETALINFNEFEQLTHYKIKRKMAELTNEQLTTDLITYLKNNSQSKLWEVIPFLDKLDYPLASEGLEKITQKIKNKEEFSIFLNLFSEAPTVIQEEMLNQFILNEHPEWKELLSKLIVKERLLLQSENVVLFFTDIFKDDKAILDLKKIAIDNADEQTQTAIGMVMQNLQEPARTKLVDYLASISFTIKEGFADQLLEEVVNNQSEDTEKVFHYILKEKPNVLFDKWKTLSLSHKETALPTLLNLQPEFLDQLVDDIRSLTDYINLKQLLQRTENFISILNHSALFSIIIEETRLMKFVEDHEKWEQLLKNIEEVEMTSLMWTNPVIWLQFTEQNIEKLFKASLSVYGIGNAVDYQIKIYEIMKYVNNQIAEEYLQVISSLSIRTNQRYSNAVIQHLTEPTLQQYFQYILKEGAAYYEGFHTSQKEADKYLIRIASLLSKKLEVVELLIAERLNANENTELLITLKHYLRELWKGLEEFNLHPMEEMENLGKEVLFDTRKHRGTDTEFADGQKVIVKSVGLRIGQETKKLAAVSMSREEVARDGLHVQAWD